MAGFWSKIVATARYTVVPGKYRVSLEQRPAGLRERYLVSLAAKRAQVPAWLVAADGRPTVNEWSRSEAAADEAIASGLLGESITSDEARGRLAALRR